MEKCVYLYNCITCVCSERLVYSHLFMLYSYVLYILFFDTHLVVICIDAMIDSVTKEILIQFFDKWNQWNVFFS